MIEEKIALMEKQLKERFLKKYYPEIAIQLIEARRIKGKAEIEYISKIQQLKRELRKEKEMKKAKYKPLEDDGSTWWGRKKTRRELVLEAQLKAELFNKK